MPVFKVTISLSWRPRRGRISFLLPRCQTSRLGNYPELDLAFSCRTGTTASLGTQNSAVGENFMSNKLQVEVHILMCGKKAISWILTHSQILPWFGLTVDFIFLYSPWQPWHLPERCSPSRWKPEAAAGTPGTCRLAPASSLGWETKSRGSNPKPHPSGGAQPIHLSGKEKCIRMPWKFSICFSLAPAALEKHSEVSIGFGWGRDGIFSASPEAYTPLGELHLYAHRMPSDCLGLYLWADPMGSPHACKWSSLSPSPAPKRQRAGFSWNLLPRQSQTRHYNKDFFSFFPFARVCARRTPRNLVFQTEVIYWNVDYLKKKNGKGYRAWFLIPANIEKRMLVSQLSECKN